MPHKRDYYRMVAQTIEYRTGARWLGNTNQRPANKSYPASIVLSFELAKFNPEEFLDKAKYALEEFGTSTFVMVAKHPNACFSDEWFLRFDIPVPENWANLSIEEVNQLADEHHWILPYYLRIR